MLLVVASLRHDLSQYFCRLGFVHCKECRLVVLRSAQSIISLAIAIVLLLVLTLVAEQRFVEQTLWMYERHLLHMQLLLDL